MSDGVMIYRGGVSTLVANIHIDKFTMATLNTMLTGWGIKQGTYRTWTKIVEFDPNFFRLGKMMTVMISQHMLVLLRLMV